MPPSLSIRSGEIVPCNRHLAPCFFASRSKTRMNRSPIAFLLASGSMIPFTVQEFVSWIDHLESDVPENGFDPFSLSFAHQTGIDIDGMSRSPIARAASAAQTELSTPPDSAITT